MQASEAVAAQGGTKAPWLSDHRALVTAILLAAHALTFALAFAPANLWFLMPVSVALISIAAIGARRTRTLLFFSFIALFVMWMVIMNWVMDVTGPGYPFMCVGMSMFGLGFVLSVRAVHRSPVFARWPSALLVPIVWTALECFRGEIAFDGYPWYFAAHPFAEFPAWSQSADLFGTYFISFLVAMCSGAIVDIVRAWRHGISLAGRLTLFLVGVIVSVNIGYGYYRLSDSTTLTQGPRIAAVQTNLPQENKIGWGREQQDRDLPGFMALTRGALRAANEQLDGADLIVWPETMLPGIGFDPAMQNAIASFGEDYAYMLHWQRELIALRNELDTPMLVGSIAWLDPQLGEKDGMRSLAPGKSYNSAYLITAEPPFARYDKFFLTPFGETMPYISKWPWLEEQLLAIGAQGMSFDLDAGTNLAPLAFEFVRDDVEVEIAIGIPICFEDSVAWVCRRMVYEGGTKRADLLINISNDGWFGASDAVRAHHLQVARFRAIENRVPMVRAVNTGLSASIDSCGRVVRALGDAPYGTPRREGWLVTQVLLDSRHTLYGRLGDMWAYGCLAVAAGMLLIAFVLKTRGTS